MAEIQSIAQSLFFRILRAESPQIQYISAIFPGTSMGVVRLGLDFGRPHGLTGGNPHWSEKINKYIMNLLMRRSGMR